MALFERLLGRGYFPKELPPPFNTRSFAILVDSWKPGTRQQHLTKPPRTYCMHHNLARPGSLRRRLGIPNPANFAALAQLVSDEWKALATFLASAKGSASRPTTSSKSVRAFESIGEKGLLGRRARNRAGARYLVSADVSACYPSLYTHAIPWALHGKATAKASKGKLLATKLGDALDRLIRDGQDQQTLGVPISPDTSWVIAEIVLAAVDNQYGASPTSGTLFRWYDDYELAFGRLSDAEAGLSRLQEALAQFELTLNPRKTSIQELPQHFEEPWLREIRGHVFRAGEVAQRSDLISFFDLLTSLVHAYPGGHILQYALKVVMALPLYPKNWKLLQHLLGQSLIVEPSVAPTVAGVLEQFTTNGMAIERGPLSEALSLLIERHVPLGHGSEVAWGLWLAIRHGASISAPATKVLHRLEDPVVALLALHADVSGRLKGTLNTKDWQGQMKTDALGGEWWLLSYEASIKGWLPSSGGIDHIAPHPFFSALRTGGVSFYDVTTATPKKAKKKPKAVVAPKTTVGGAMSVLGF